MKNPNRTADTRRAAEGKVQRETLIIVNSRHDSALRYAEWIQKALDADMIAYSKKYLGYAAVYRNVLYIGWIRSGDIQGLNLLQQNHSNFHLSGKHLSVVGVGIGDDTDSYRTAIEKRNYINGFADSFHILTGRFDPESVRASDVAAMRSFTRQLDALYDASDVEIIAHRMKDGYNGIDMKAIDPIVEEFRTL